MKRWFKYKYLLLLRAKGGASMVALGFSIGFAVEMFTLPTIGLAFFLIFPLVYFFRASFAGALIGFAFGKTIYIPFAFINSRVGAMLVSKQFKISFAKSIHFLPKWIEHILVINMQLIVGGIVVGVVIGIMLYFPVKLLLEVYTQKRKEKRKLKKTKILLHESVQKAE